MNTLLEKFTKVKLKTSTLLPADDKEAMDILHAQYETAMEQLDEWRSFYEMQEKKDPLPGWSVKEHNYSNGQFTQYTVIKPDRSKTDPFRHMLYYPGYSLIAVRKLKNEVAVQYVSKVYSYFSDKYSLDIKTNINVVDIKQLTYLDVVNEIRAQLGSLNFNSIARDQIIDRFRKLIGWRSTPELAGKNLILVEFIYFGSYSSGTIDYNNKYLRGIEDTVMLYERDHAMPGAMFNSLNHYGKSVDYENDYTFINCEKLDAIRIYKNRKVILKFKTALMAKEFYEMLDLETINK